jgi:DNA-binding CsgD family transcriptional regulator
MTRHELIFDHNDKNLDPRNFNFIPTVKYENLIRVLCQSMLETVGSEYFSIAIFSHSQKFVISNNPGKVAIPYHLRKLSKIDHLFWNNEIQQGCFVYPADFSQFDPLTQLFLSMIRDEFNAYNHFSLRRSKDTFALNVVFGGPNKMENPLQCYQSNHSILEKMLFDFIHQLRAVFNDMAPWLNRSPLLRDEAYLRQFLKHENKLNQVLLSEGEIECLFWFRQGLAAKETASKTKYSPLTVSSYLKSAREKFHVKSTQEAMLLGLEQGYFV